MCLFDSDNWIFERDHLGLLETMLRKEPNGQKICYLLQTNSKIPYLMCDWENRNPRGIYTDDQNRVHTREEVAQMMTIAIHFNQTCGSIY